MKTTIEFLDEVKSHLALTSDTQVALALGITKSHVSYLRNKTNFLGEESARRVAMALDIDPAYVIACANAERASSEDIRKVWQRVAEAFATIALGVTLYAPSPNANAQSDQTFNNNIHYTKYKRRQLLAA